MRFGFAHKLSTYLVALTAYLALTLSGELEPVQVLLALIGIVASWWWEPPRVDLARYGKVWTGLSLVVFAYSVLSFLAGGDVLLIGAHFLMYLVVAKLFNRRAVKDYLQVYILTFLMLVAGTVLNSGFSYGVFFLGYVVFSTWAMILLHLRREIEENFLLRHGSASSSERVAIDRVMSSRRIVSGRFLFGTSLASLVVFLSATVLFLAIPRIGFGLFFNKKRGGTSMAGFSDGVKLGGHGTIKNDPTVVMRVKVDKRFRGRGAPSIHWRGVAFDRYDNGEWRRSPKAPPTAITYDHDMERGLAWVHLRYDRMGDPSSREMEQIRASAMRQEIYLEPMDNDVLFGASMPVAFEFDDLRPKERAATNDELRHPHGAGIRYTVYSSAERPPDDVLRAAPERMPIPDAAGNRRVPRDATYRVYLEVPPEITARTRALARDITRDAPTRYDKAVAIERWLQENLDYTLQQEQPTTEPIDFFLFERKKGHCEYFSSAMTIMLREVGVPARNVNGFLGGEWNEYDDYIAVRGGDAHSWVEVLFPGVGWVTFDPTPPGEADQLGPGGTGLLDKLERLMDTLRFKWFQWVIEYDLHRQLSVFKSLRNAFGGGSQYMKQQMADLKTWAAANKKAFGALASAAAAAIAAVVWWRRRRQALAALGVPRKLTGSQSAVATLYLAASDKLARKGYRRGDATTPREHAADLVRRRAPGARPFAELSEVYYRAVYGAAEGAELVARARALRGEVAEAVARRRAS